MMLGIRKLVDNDSRTDSLLSVVNRIEKRPELLTREFYVCHDGLPFDDKAAEKRYYESITLIDSIPTLATFGGPDDYRSSRVLHQKFDALSKSKSRKRLDKIDPCIISRVKDELKSPLIKKITTAVDKVVAHAERGPERSNSEKIERPAQMPTLNEIDQAIESLIMATNFVSSTILYSSSLGTPVPTPNFDVFSGLDQPWASPETSEYLADYWNIYCEEIDRSTQDFEKKFLAKPADSCETQPHHD